MPANVFKKTEMLGILTFTGGEKKTEKKRIPYEHEI